MSVVGGNDLCFAMHSCKLISVTYIFSLRLFIRYPKSIVFCSILAICLHAIVLGLYMDLLIFLSNTHMCMFICFCVCIVFKYFYLHKLLYIFSFWCVLVSSGVGRWTKFSFAYIRILEFCMPILKFIPQSWYHCRWKSGNVNVFGSVSSKIVHPPPHVKLNNDGWTHILISLIKLKSLFSSWAPSDLRLCSWETISLMPCFYNLFKIFSFFLFWLMKLARLYEHLITWWKEMVLMYLESPYCLFCYFWSRMNNGTCFKWLFPSEHSVPLLSFETTRTYCNRKNSFLHSMY